MSFRGSCTVMVLNDGAEAIGLSVPNMRGNSIQGLPKN